MSSQLSAHAITAHTAMTRISVSRCSTLPAHRGSASAEKCSTSFSTDIAILPSSIKGEPAQPVSPSELARPFHASPLPRLHPHQRPSCLQAQPTAALPAQNARALLSPRPSPLALRPQLPQRRRWLIPPAPPPSRLSRQQLPFAL